MAFNFKLFKYFIPRPVFRLYGTGKGEGQDAISFLYRALLKSLSRLTIGSLAFILLFQKLCLELFFFHKGEIPLEVHRVKYLLLLTIVYRARGGIDWELWLCKLLFMKENERFFVDLVHRGYLKISKEGTVFNTKTGNFIGRNRNKKGYIGIRWGDFQIQAHRLIYLIFCGEIGEGKEINHKDGNKQNNCIDNLEAVTPSENHKHAYRIGLKSQEGEQNSIAVFTDEQVTNFRSQFKNGETSILDIQKIVSAHWVTVYDMLKGKTYSHLGNFCSIERRLGPQCQSKLTEELAKEILDLKKNGFTNQAISDRLGVARGSVDRYYKKALKGGL